MPTYLLTGKYASGEQFALRIDAVNAQVAKAELESRGCVELKLHEDDVSSAVLHRFRSETNLSAKRTLELWEKGSATLQEAAWGSFKMFALPNTVLILLAALNFIRGRPALAWGWLAIFLCLYAYAFWFALPLLWYARLNHAKEWERWEDVLVWCNRLERLGRLRKHGMTSSGIAYSRAQALAGIGRLKEGVELLTSLEETPETPKWLQLSFLAIVYDTGREYDRAIEVMCQAIELNPSASILYVGLAEKLILKKRDAAQASEVLRKAEALPLAELASPFLLHCKGRISLEEGDYLKAKMMLIAALKEAEKFQKQSLMPGVIRQFKASWCIAYAKAGEVAAAKELLKELRHYLASLRDPDLLNECELCIAEAEQAKAHPGPTP